jgi:hypothetical protein
MIRLARALCAAVVLVALIAGPSLAAPPTHEYAPAGPIEFGAGELCDFPLRLSTVVDRGKTTTFAPGTDGSQRVETRGFASSLLENLDTGKQVTYAGGYRLSFRIAADGSVRADGTGQITAFYLEGDVTELGAGIWSVEGHVTEHYDATGTFLFATFDGRATDLCALIAPGA